MPTKCIVQIATASENAAAASNRRRRMPTASPVCTARLKPTYAPWIAITIESSTSHGSYVTGTRCLPLASVTATASYRRLGRIINEFADEDEGASRPGVRGGAPRDLAARCRQGHLLRHVRHGRPNDRKEMLIQCGNRGVANLGGDACPLAFL